MGQYMEDGQNKFTMTNNFFLILGLIWLAPIKTILTP
jgi:hypothetical protein